MSRPADQLCEDEADWRTLSQLVKKAYGRSYVKLAMLRAKLTWYEMHYMWEKYARYIFRLYEICPPDFTSLQECKKVSLATRLDTYASLLYKAGRTPEAIKWQTEACKLEPGNKSHLAALRKMIKGEAVRDSR